MRVRGPVLAMMTVGVALAVPDIAGAEPRIAGHVEDVVVAGTRLSARLDTGAAVSSLDARGTTTIRRDGRTWVRFRIGGGNRDDRASPSTAEPIEAELVRTVRIRRAGAGAERRLVVRLPVCLAGQTIDAEVTLSDRRTLDHPMLIGRAALAGLLVDATRTHLTAPDCPARP